jgi:hypothetical protein
MDLFWLHAVTKMPARRRQGLLAGMTSAVVGLAGCGGSGGGNPLNNPPVISNQAGTSGQNLCFAYFQKCVNPIFFATQATGNTCAAAGCHDNANGTGGALRLFPTPVPPLVDMSLSPQAIKATDMYKNFYSSQGEVVIGSPLESRLVTKPRVLNVLHGGGLIFTSDQDLGLKRFEYWINHPAPKGQDEFGAACYSMFTPSDPAAYPDTTTSCNTN